MYVDSYHTRAAEEHGRSARHAQVCVGREVVGEKGGNDCPWHTAKDPLEAGEYPEIA